MSERAPTIVSVDFHCSRKNKDYPVKLELKEAAAFVELQEQKQEVAREIGKVFADLPVLPDCVVLYKGKVVVLANVHTSSDSAVGRLLNEATQQNVFPTKDPKPRKRKPADKNEAAAIEIDVDDAEADA